MSHGRWNTEGEEPEVGAGGRAKQEVHGALEPVWKE